MGNPPLVWQYLEFCFPSQIFPLLLIFQSPQKAVPCMCLGLLSHSVGRKRLNTQLYLTRVQTPPTCFDSLHSTYSKMFKNLCLYLFGCIVAAWRTQFPDQGQNPSRLHWELGILALGQPGKPHSLIFLFIDSFACCLSPTPAPSYDVRFREAVTLFILNISGHKLST